MFLETNRYNEGIQYLVGTLNSDEHNWNQQIQQEIYMVLAQLHVQLQQWEEATGLSGSGPSGISGRIIAFPRRFFERTAP